MKVGLRYSRKDVCKMLGFDSNQESTIYGYKVDKTTKTCPIFVTYKKDEDISASQSMAIGLCQNGCCIGSLVLK